MRDLTAVERQRLPFVEMVIVVVVHSSRLGDAHRLIVRDVAIDLMRVVGHRQLKHVQLFIVGHRNHVDAAGERDSFGTRRPNLTGRQVNGIQIEVVTLQQLHFIVVVRVAALHEVAVKFMTDAAKDHNLLMVDLDLQQLCARRVVDPVAAILPTIVLPILVSGS